MPGPYIPTRWLITTPDLADDPDVFPLLSGQEFLSQKSPTFPPTIVRRSISGREIRASFGDYPFWQFKVAYQSIKDRATKPELARLNGFFCSRIGQYGTFFYYDPFDHLVSNVSIGIGDGVTTAFQLVRQVGAGTPNVFVEPVYVVNGTPTVTIDGTPTVSFTIGAFGAITFGSAPPAGKVIAWSGSFMFLCRFAADQMDPAQMIKALWSMSGLGFQSWLPL